MIPLLLQEILFLEGNCTDEYLQFLLMIFENFSLKKMTSHFKCLDMIFNKSYKIYAINVKHYKQLLRFLLIYEHSNESFKSIVKVFILLYFSSLISLNFSIFSHYKIFEKYYNSLLPFIFI